MKKILKENHVSTFHEPPTSHYFAPATVLMLGEGADVLKGVVLAATLEDGLYASVSHREDFSINLCLDFYDKKETHTIDLINMDQDDTNRYVRLFRALIKKLQYESYTVQKGLDITIMSSENLPGNLGLHPSFMMLSITVLNDQNRFGLDLKKLVRFAYQAESDLRELNSNIAQHFTCAFAKKNHILSLDTKTLKYELIPFDHDNHTLMSVFVNRPKFIVDADITDRIAALRKSTTTISDFRSIEALSELSFDEFNRLKSKIKNAQTLQYSEHAYFEQERVTQAAEYLREGDYVMFGDTLEQSQNSIRELYGTSNVYFDDIISKLMRTGALGARLCDIGYDNIIIGLYEKADTPENLSVFEKEFYSQYKKNLDIKPLALGDGLSALADDESDK